MEEEGEQAAEDLSFQLCSLAVQHGRVLSPSLSLWVFISLFQPPLGWLPCLHRISHLEHAAEHMCATDICYRLS